MYTIDKGPRLTVLIASTLLLTLASCVRMAPECPLQISEDRIAMARLMPKDVAWEIVFWHVDPINLAYFIAPRDRSYPMHEVGEAMQLGDDRHAWQNLLWTRYDAKDIEFSGLRVYVPAQASCNCVAVEHPKFAFNAIDEICISQAAKLNEFVDAFIALGAGWGGNQMRCYGYPC